MSDHDPYAFLSPAAVVVDDRFQPLLRSPIEAAHVTAGAAIEEHEGWRIAVYENGAAGLWLSDLSHLGKLDLRGTESELEELTGGLAPGQARADGDIWTLRLTPTHGYVVCPFTRVGELRARIGSAAVDASCGLAAVALGGEGWREVWMRSSGLDAREQSFGPGCCLAGSVMRAQTIAVNLGEHVLMLVGWEFAEYFWEALLDAGAEIGLVPVTLGVGAGEIVGQEVGAG